MNPLFNRLGNLTLILAALSIAAIACNLSIFTVLYPVIVAFKPLPGWAGPIGNVVAAAFSSR